MSQSDKGDGLPSGAERESTSGLMDIQAPLKRELATNEVSRLRDYSGSLEKGAGREFTSGLRD